jgi:tetratricopeptide (TPR) repeat protein
MPHKHRFLSTLHFFAIAAAMAICIGCLHSTGAQPLPNVPSTNRSPNPKVIIKYILVGRPDDRAKQPSITTSPTQLEEERRRQSIERAIDEGNHARDANQYERAVASYERVTKELNPKDPRGYYGLGNVYSDFTCSDSALGQYREALRLQKDFHDARIALAYGYANQERYDESEQQFRNVLSTASTNTAAKIGLATVSAKRKKYDEAVNQLNLITNTQSLDGKDRALAHLALGDIYQEQKKWLEAAAEYQKTISLNPDIAVVYIKLGQTELLPAMERFTGLVVQEFTPEDRARVNKAAIQATKYVRQAIYEHNYNHPYGYLFLAIGLEYQFSFREAESNLRTYLAKVKELETQLSSLATTKTCDYGFAALYASGYRFLALLYGQEALLETDRQRLTELRNLEIENIRNVIRRKEDDAAAYSSLGRIFYLQGKYAEAIEQYNKALSLNTNESTKAMDHAALGLAYSAVGRTADSIEYLNRAIRIKPDEPLHYQQLAQIYKTQGNFDEAINNLKNAIEHEREPTAHSYYFLASAYFLRARQKGNDADYEEGIRLAGEAIKINRSYASAYLILGNIYRFYKNGTKMDEALANYELAAKYDPNNHVVYANIGDLYFGVKHNDEAAIYNFRKAIEVKPDYVDAYVQLAQVYRRKNDQASAVKQLLEAIRLDGKSLDAYSVLIDIYKSQKNYAEATTYLNKILEIAPQHFYPYKELAKISEAQQKKGDAIRYYQQAISFLKPDDTFGKELYLCRIERLRERYVDAIGCFQKLKGSTSEDPGQQAYDIGLTYVASKNKKAALAQYEQLKQSKSSLAEDLLSQINEMK